MVAPPKPWERQGATGTTTTGTTTTSGTGTGTGTGTTPALPARPAAMNGTTGTTTGTTLADSSLGSSSLTSSSYSSPYSRYGSGGYSSFSSPYSRFGSPYGGGGYGGYGGGFGSYGGGYGGGYGSYGGFGSGYGGFGGSPYGLNNGVGGAGGPPSLTQQMESGTAATFEMIQSIVGAFGGFAQMLESTFMATHSSFFAMIGVAEQFGHLRNYLGQVLSVFALVRWMKGFLNRIRGKGGSGVGGDWTADDFKAFEARGGVNPAAGGKKVRPSKKPLIIFFLTIVGLPYLMTKLVRSITRKQQEEETKRRMILSAAQQANGGQPLSLEQQQEVLARAAQQGQLQQQPQPDGQTMMGPGGRTVSLNDDNASGNGKLDMIIDPSSLTFVRALHPYQPSSSESNSSSPEASVELSFNQNDIIAVLTPKEERTQPGWWRGRLRDGRIGWFPSTYVEEIPMPGNKTNMGDNKIKAIEEENEEGKRSRVTPSKTLKA